MMAVRRSHWVRNIVIASLLLSAWGEAQGQSCMPLGEGEKTQNRPVGVISAVALRVPQNAWLHYGKAVTAARAQRVEEAEREIAKALAITPAFAEPYVLRAVQEIGKGHFQAAIAAALDARRVDPRTFWAGVILAGAYNGVGRYREAAAAIADVSGAEADSWQATYEMTRAVVGIGNVAEALRWSALALAAVPATCIDKHILRGDAFLLAHRWSEAVAQLTLYVDSPQPQHHRAEVLRVIERATRLAAEEQHETMARAGDRALLP